MFQSRGNWSTEEGEPLIGSSQTITTDQVQLQIDQTTSAANETIGKLLRRGEDIEDIKGKSGGFK